MALHTLWLVVIGLVVFAMVLLSGLILARAIRDRLLEHRARQRKAITKALLAIALEDDASALKPFASKDLLLAETAQGLADLVRGPELERMKAALARYGLGPKLALRLRRGRKRQRMVAAEALALLPGGETVQALNAARADRSPEVRLAAMFSLLDLGEAPSVSEILQTVGSGEWSHSLLVTELLRRLGRDRQTQLAQEIQRPDVAPQVQVMLLEAVRGAGDFEVLPTVAAQTSDRDPAVRAAAVRAMGRLSHPNFQPQIGRALDDIDSRVRRDAVLAAHRAGLHELAPALGRRLNDPVWEVRHAAARALVDFGSPGLAILTRVRARATPDRRREISLAMEGPTPW